jgi:toxin FitB
MKYLLDTSVITELILSAPNQSLVNFVDSLDQEDLYLSTITLGELAKGIEKLPKSQKKQDLETRLRDDLLIRFEGHIISLDDEVMIQWGKMSARLEALGIILPAVDSFIAATVMTHHMVLVTLNENDFQNTEIEIVNPW